MKKVFVIVLVTLGLRVDAQAQVLPSAPSAAGTVSMAEAAASKIKAEEAGVKNRRAAVRYLGTVDWHYYPEAEAALIAALRADRNEQVRLEAVHSLGSHICTKKGIDALNIVLTGSELDGNPAENSERIKAAALLALHHSVPKTGEVIGQEGGPKQPVLNKQPPTATALFISGFQDERAFAEKIGAPKTPLNIPYLPPTSARTSGISGLTPIGVIPRE